MIRIAALYLNQRSRDNSFRNLLLKLLFLLLTFSINAQTNWQSWWLEVHEMQQESNLQPEDLAVLYPSLEKRVATIYDPAHRAIAQMTMAGLYTHFYLEQQFQIGGRTDIADYVPSDMQEWSKKHFEHKIRELMKFSETQLEQLKKISVEQFKEIFELTSETISVDITPTLYDVVIYHKKTFLSHFDAKEAIIEALDQLITFRKQELHLPALVFAELSKNELLQESTPNDYTSVLQRLDSLELLYHQYPEVVEILHVKAKTYLHHITKSGNKRIAYRICEDGIRKFPDYPRIHLLSNLLNEINSQFITVVSPTVVRPNQNAEITFTTKNIQTLIIRRYAVNADAASYRLYLENRRINDAPFPDRILVDSQKVHIPFNPDFEPVTTSATFSAGEYGIYEFECFPENITTATKPTEGYYIVTDLAFFRRTHANGSLQYYVVDRVNGRPIPNVNILLKHYRWHQDRYIEEDAVQGTTSRQGECILTPNSNENRHLLFFNKGKDEFLFADDWSFSYRYHPQKRSATNVDLFTDRSIYRPGQTVHFNAIAYHQDEHSVSVAEGQLLEVYLYGANGKELAVKSIFTNEFGSASGSFKLPTEALNGHFSIRTKSMGSVHFMVEDYKMPGFEISVAESSEEMNFGDTVRLTGEVKAYAGYSLPNAQVAYVITRIKHPWMRRSIVAFSKQVAAGNTMTDLQGQFQVEFIPVKELVTDVFQLEAYRYQIELIVTDASGETHQTTHSIFVGDISIKIQAEVPDLIERNSPVSVSISTLNLNNKLIPKMIHYRVEKLNLTTDFYEQMTDDSETESTGIVLTGTMNSTGKSLILNPAEWKNGLYQLIATTLDSRGHEITSTHRFIVYDHKLRRPPLPVQAWLPTSEITANKGERVSIDFGSSYKNLRVLYEVLVGDSVITSKWIGVNGKIRTFKIPFKNSFQNGFTVHFTFMKNEQLVRKQVNVRPLVPERKLTPHFSVFRGAILPGSTEKWTISIPEVAATLIPAELMVSIYDASLDQIQPHQWYFNPIPSPIFPFSSAMGSMLNEQQTNIEHYRKEDQHIPEFKRAFLKIWEVQFGNRWHGTIFSRSVSDNLIVRGAKQSMASTEILEEESDSPLFMILEDNYQSPPHIQYRSLFNETALFRSQLVTDSLGEAHFTFTIPEQLTRWKIKILAHNNQLMSGISDTVFVTSQPLTARMHLPRFVRTGDRWVMSSTISNLSDETLTIKVQPEIKDNINEVSLLEENSQQTIVLAPGTSETLSWEANSPATAGWMESRISATGMTLAGYFTDGEQREVPVLSDEILITHTQPLLIRDKSESTFSMEAITSAAQLSELTAVHLEFSANPISYAIQALPAMAKPTTENSLDLFGAWYANSMINQLMEKHPYLRSMLKEWYHAGEDDDSKISPLERNQELKNVLLESTPWVVQAAGETSQQQQWKAFLENERPKNQIEKYWQQLSERQLPSGGFAWQTGMAENRWLTQWILLKMSGISTDEQFEEQQTTLRKGLEYLDGCIVKDYLETTQKVKKYAATRTITPLQLQYLVLRSNYNSISMSPATFKAFNYYQTQIIQYQQQFSLYEKAMAAIFLARTNHEEQAGKLLRSLLRESVQSADKGMYWPSRRAGPSWHERPIGLHVVLMEAFSSMPGYEKELEEMKLWLLLQKQTQRWEDPVSTLDAVNQLLKKVDSIWSQNTYDILSGDILLASTKGIRGIGYVKRSLDVTQLPTELKIQRSTDLPTNSTMNTAWGAVYWQSILPMANVKSSGSGMTITKQLFVKRINEDLKYILIPVGSQTVADLPSVKRSDRIVSRLVLIADRDYEYVSLRDEKSAALEAVDKTSGLGWCEGVAFYRTPKGTSTQYFFDYLPKGYYVFEEEYFVHTPGRFMGGTASVQCLYAPEYNANAQSEIIWIE